MDIPICKDIPIYKDTPVYKNITIYGDQCETQKRKYIPKFKLAK